MVRVTEDWTESVCAPSYILMQAIKEVNR